MPSREIDGRADRRDLIQSLLLGAGLLAVMSFAIFAIRLHDLLARRAVGPAWMFPSRVYSSDVLLMPGRELPPGILLAQLAARGYRSAPAPLARPGTYARSGGNFEIFLRGFLDAPDPAGSGGPERVRVALADGRVAGVRRLGGLDGATPPDRAHPPRLEPALFSFLFDEGRVRRTWVPLERVPRVMQDAIIAAEDRRFYGHIGFDVRANARALLRNVREGAVREGGSTITQQLARGLFLGGQRTFDRKLAEIPLAIGIELLLGKRRILEMYLNSVYWGQAGSVGIGGIAEASRWYFNLPVDSLRVVEAATLAAMIPSPNAYDPFEHPEAARERRDLVLDDMASVGKLDPGLAARAKELPLNVRRGPMPVERFPSYAGYVRGILDRDLPHHAAQGWGLEIFTNMDLVRQRDAELELERRVGWLGRGLQGAFVALEPASGAVQVMVGGRGVREGDFNRAYQARRQTGSAIKPIVYAAAFAQGGTSFTPATTVSDEPRTFGERRWKWTPRNYGGSYHEVVTLALALAKSLNVATTNLVERVGPHTIAQVAERFGLGSLKPVMSIGLGSNETTLLALTNAYAVFANGGRLPEPSPIRVVVEGGGDVLLGPPDPPEEVLPADVAALMTGLLEDVVRYGVATPLHAAYGFERPAAGKTGTTDQFHDAWFVGYTPQLVGGVWVGYDRPRNIGRPAAHTALPVWAAIMNDLLGDCPALPFASDAQLQYVAIDPWRGLLADSTCPQMQVPFLPGTAPTMMCYQGIIEEYPFGESDSLSQTGEEYYTPEPDTFSPLPPVTPLAPERPVPPAESTETESVQGGSGRIHIR